MDVHGFIHPTDMPCARHRISHKDTVLGTDRIDLRHREVKSVSQYHEAVSGGAEV